MNSIKIFIDSKTKSFEWLKNREMKEKQISNRSDVSHYFSTIRCRANDILSTRSTYSDIYTCNIFAIAFRSLTLVEAMHSTSSWIERGKEKKAFLTLKNVSLEEEAHEQQECVNFHNGRGSQMTFGMWMNNW